MTELIDSMLTWLAAHEGPLAYLAFGAASLIEYVVPPFPGDTIALFGVFLCVSAGWSVPAVYGALNAGSLVGGMLAYAAGVWLRDRERRPVFLRGPRATAAFARLGERYAAYGALYLALNRFVPALRAFFFVAAGIAGLPAGRVAFYGLLSALVWNGILLGAGIAIGASFEQLERAVGVYGFVVLVAVALVALALAGRALARRLLGPGRVTGAGPTAQTTAPGANAPGAEEARSGASSDQQ